MTAAAWRGESGTYTMTTPWLAGQSELGAAVLLKAVLWGMRLASLLTHLFYKRLHDSYVYVHCNLVYRQVSGLRPLLLMFSSLSKKRVYSLIPTGERNTYFDDDSINVDDG